MSEHERRLWSELWAAPRLRQGLQSLALALLMAGITVAAVKVFGWQARVRRGRLPSSAQPSSALPSAAIHRSPSELFAAAHQARTQGNALEAIRLSKQIEQFFPNSEEGINSHLTLGVLYLEQDRAALALQEFASFRLVGSPELKAEAYFGQAQALRKLSRFEDERTVLSELVRSYPRSVYVAAARTRLSELCAGRRRGVTP
jgi:outer membrane protein assembly factor BamD (BamD/ComL family)